MVGTVMAVLWEGLDSEVAATRTWEAVLTFTDDPLFVSPRLLENCVTLSIAAVSSGDPFSRM